jgi:hypothetical protein
MEILGFMFIYSMQLEKLTILDLQKVQNCFILSFIRMEGWEILEIMKEMSKLKYIVTHILHDKDVSTMKNILQIFQDV